MNSHQQHLLNLLRDAPTSAAVSQLASLDDADWGQIIHEAEQLGVSPLLHRNVDRLQIAVPDAVRAQVRKILEQHTARNMRLLREFGSLARALHKQKIDFVPMKGVHLCTSLYENIGERPAWDIDLLVPLEKIAGAVRAIEGTGYRASRPYDLDLEVRNYHHLPAFIKRGAPPVEIHWTLLNPRFHNGLNWQELWERSVSARVGDVDVRVFAPGDLLVYLCAHVAYQHIYIDSLRSLHDISRLVRKYSGELEWGAIAARARTWGLANSVYLTLRLTDDLLGCSLPEEVWQSLRPTGFSEKLVAAGLHRILGHAENSPVVSAVWSKPGTRSRIRALWSRLAVPRSILAGRYRLPPGSLRVYPYYLVRAWDLLRAHGRDLWQLAVGRQSKRELAVQESELIAYLRWWQ